MNIRYHTQNYTITQDLRSYTEYQLQKIERLADPLGAAVYIARNTHHQKGDIFDVEINIHIPKKIIKAREKNAGDVRSVVALVEQKLNKQLIKFKAKRVNNRSLADQNQSRSIKAFFQGIRRGFKQNQSENENNCD